MKFPLIILSLLIPAAAFAADSKEVRALKAKCKEETSMARRLPIDGKPSCDLLQKVLDDNQGKVAPQPEERTFDSKEIRDLQTKCKEETSRARRLPVDGKPSCDLLEKILKPEKTTPQQEDLTYEWNGGANRFCYYNKARELLSCP